MGQARRGRTGVRDGVISAEAQRVRELGRENKELRRANECMKLAFLDLTLFWGRAHQLITC